MQASPVPGSPEEAPLVDALKDPGFHFRQAQRRGRAHARSRNYWGGGLACTDIYTVRWRTGPDGRLADVTGDVEGSC